MSYIIIINLLSTPLEEMVEQTTELFRNQDGIMITKIKKYLFVSVVLSICMTQEEASAQTNSNEDIVTAPNSI